MSDQKKRLLADFSDALGKLVAAGLSDLDDEKAQAVSAALQARTATIQLAISTSPVVVACFLRSRDPAVPMHPLFRIEIDGGMPSETTN
jgi:hypothetical protein